MKEHEIQKLAKDLGWSSYDYYGSGEDGEVTLSEDFNLKDNTILDGNVTDPTIKLNGYKVYIVGTYTITGTKKHLKT